MERDEPGDIELEGPPVRRLNQKCPSRSRWALHARLHQNMSAISCCVCALSYLPVLELIYKCTDLPPYDVIP